jgi:hypothetical protein
MCAVGGDVRHNCMRVVRTALAATAQQPRTDGSGAVASSLPPEQAGRAMAAVQTGVAWNVPRLCTEEPG